MPVRLSCATGNFGTSTTWATVDATSYLNSETGNTALTTSMVASSTATPGAITVDGVAVKLASVSASPSGTITVEIAQGGVQVAGATCTINVADLPLCTTTGLEGGWIFFKFAAPVTLAAATAYTVRAKTSVAAMVNLFTNGTAANWSRALRTTTTAAPAAGDDLIIAGEHTGAGTGNNITVTMDSTAATAFGSNTTTPVTPSLAVCKRGTLTWGTAAATNYLLRQLGHVIVYNGGAWNQGTVATPVPRGSTAFLEFQCTAAGDFGFIARNGSAVVVQGLSRTTGKLIWACNLTADAAANATALNVDQDTGWLSGDAIAVASTTRTNTDCENGTLNGNASSASLTVNGFAGTAGGLLVAHGGASGVVAEIVLLTRNVGMRSTSASAYAFVNFKATATVTIAWAEFYNLSVNTAGKRGIEIETTTGSCSMTYCSVHNCGYSGVLVTGTTVNNITLQFMAIYNTAITAAAFNGALAFPATTGTACTLDSIIIMLTIQGSTRGFILGDVGIVCTNVTVVGTGVGFQINEPAPVTGTLGPHITHSNTSDGFTGIGWIGGNAATGTWRSWRNNGTGFDIQTGAGSAMLQMDFDTLVMFGNATTNLGVAVPAQLTFKNLTSAGDTTFATTSGIAVTAGVNIAIQGGALSPTSGIYAVHTNDIVVNNVNPAGGGTQVVLNNTGLGGTNQVSGQASLAYGSQIRATRIGGVSGAHKTWGRNGTILANATTFNTAAPSEELQPNNAAAKLQSLPRFRLIDSGGAIPTVNVYVRKSSAYNGNAPRLMQRANGVVQLLADTALATHSAAADTWQQLSGTPAATSLDNDALEFFVDGDGTAGSVFADDWSFS